MRRTWILRAFVVAAAASCGGDTPTGPPPTPVPTQLSVATQPAASVANGSTLTPQPAVRLRDAQGIPAALAGVTVTAQLTGGGAVLGGAATATTNSSGIATFSGLALTGTVGSYTLQFTSAGLTAADANPIALTPGAPTALALAVAPSSAAQAGAALAQQPQVRLKDQSGNDAAGSVTVTASLVAGTVAVANATAVTNAAGLAVFNGLALAGATGSYTLRFTASGLTTVDAATPTVLAAGPPTQLAVTTQPSASLLNGGTFATQPALELRDAFGNAATQAGTSVTAAIITGTGTLSGTTTVTTDSLGRAAFTNLGITGTAGNFTLRFSATGVTSVVSNTIAVSAGAAARVRITTTPQFNATSGVALPTQPVTQIQDTSGNAVASAGVVVTAGIIATSGGPLPTITSGTATTDATGKATFSGLTVTGLAATYLLTFSAPGLGADTTQTPVFLQAGTATKLVLVQQPGTPAVNGQRQAVQPVVRLQDVSGNSVAQSNLTVTASLVSGTATLSHASKPTNASGVAVFDSLAITGTVGSYRLRFSAPGMADVDSSQAIILVPGAASQLALTTPPSTTAQTGVALATQPVVQLRDTGGNAVAQSSVTITAKVVGGGATVTNATAITGVAGAATFAGLTLTGSVGSYVLRFSAPNVDSVDAAVATVLNPGPPASLTIVTMPPDAATSGVALVTAPVVEVLDGAGNPVAGVVVGAAAGGYVTLTGNQATTGANGRAMYAGLTLTGLVSGYNLQFCVGANCASASILTASPLPTSLAAGAPATLTLSTPPSAAGQSGITLAQQPVAVVQDASGNAVPGVAVTASATGASVAGGTALTDASGTAPFAGLTVSGAPAGYTLQFAAGSATASSALALSAGPPATVTLTQAPSGSAASGIVFAPQPIARLRDATGNGVAGVAVTVTVSGGATVLGDSAVTDGAGNAAFSDLGLSGSAAPYTLTFTAGSVSTGASVTLLAGPVAAVSLTQQPSTTAVNGAALAQQPVVFVQDGSANAVTGAVVTASLTTGGAAVSHATAVTNSSGLATFTGLSLFGTIGSYTLQFTVSGLPPVTALAPTSLGAGPAAKLMFVTQPSASAQNTVALLTQPGIQITDAGGNPVLQAGTTITASIPGGGPSLTSASALTSGTGAATFSGLAMTGIVGSYRLRFSAPLLASVDAAAATVLQPGPATHLMLTTEPSASTPANVVMARQPVAQLRDVSHNNVGQAGVAVTVASTGGTLALAGTTTVSTDVSGAASFTDIVANGPRGSHLLRFTSTSPAFAVNATDSTVVALPLSISVPVSDSGGFDTEHPYVVTTQPGDTLLVVTIFGGTGTADLYVRHGAAPDPEHGLFDCFPRLAGSNETCRFRNPASGAWYVTIVGFPFSYAGVTLTVNTYP